MMLASRFMVVLGVLGISSVPVLAQPATQPASVLKYQLDKYGNRPLLGETFSSKAAGIEFRAPADSVEVRKAGIADLIVEFVNEANQTHLRVGTLELREDRKLEDSGSGARKKTGILSEIADGFEKQNPAAERLRREVIKTAKGYEVGVLAYRYPQGAARKFMQQAIFPVTDRFYYSLTYTSPGVKLAEGEIDPQEKTAADTFSEILDSVKLFDRTEIARDQEQRNNRAKALIDKIRGPQGMQKAMIPDRWVRLTRDGKDIGYSHITEEKAKQDGRDGVRITIQSRTSPAPDAQIDVTSTMFVSDGWLHESWSHEAVVHQGKQTNETTEFGLASFDEQFKAETPKDLLNANQRKTDEVKDISRWKLQVRTSVGSSSGKPFETMLPATYMPQAILQLLPRMLAKQEPSTYMFLSYVSDVRQVMVRYVDVEPLAEVQFEGTKFKAIAVHDRLGLEGVPTVTYISPDGKWMGSETTSSAGGKRTTVRVIPSDEATLVKLWGPKTSR